MKLRRWQKEGGIESIFNKNYIYRLIAATRKIPNHSAGTKMSELILSLMYIINTEAFPLSISFILFGAQVYSCCPEREALF